MFLGTGSPDWEQLQQYARLSKEIVLNPSTPVGRIDGGRHLYAPRRCRMSEVVREYCFRSILSKACGLRTVACLVRRPVSSV